MEFIYTNTSGGASVIGSFNGSGWTLGAKISLALAAFLIPLTIGTWTLAGREVVALLAVAFVTLVNARGVRGTGRAQEFLAWTPIILFLLMALWAVFQGFTAP
ncbi:MAG: hypothetical protein WCQ21_27220, partial [Verrucomicrobiota bacterium]